jgi:NAD-dependent SIR2 family protein deacetylase
MTRLVQDGPKADLVIVMGTSLKVHPANDIISLLPDSALKFWINIEASALRLPHSRTLHHIPSLLTSSIAPQRPPEVRRPAHRLLRCRYRGPRQGHGPVH